MTKTHRARIVGACALWILSAFVMADALYNLIAAVLAHRPEADVFRAAAVGIAGFAAYLTSRFLSPYEEVA